MQQPVHHRQARRSDPPRPSHGGSDRLPIDGYSRDPNGAVARLRRRDIGSGNDVIIVGIVFAIVLALLMLTYFLLFLYNRIRHPSNDIEDNAGMIKAVPRRTGAKSESQNQIVTKDELMGRSMHQQADAMEKPETYWRGLAKGAFCEQPATSVSPATTAAAATLRGLPKDATSDGSEETSESVVKYDLPAREELNELDEVVEKPAAHERQPGRVRLSGEFQRYGLDGEAKSLRATREERSPKDYIPEFANHYRLHVRKEQKSGSGLLDMEKIFWK